ncbi:MAG: mycofactocin biosynthesis chaperone MftB [Acidimicrobiales bacterium]
MTPPEFDASSPWSLSPEVSLRDEEFGALAYHHGSRRLVFLKSRRLVELASVLASHPSADSALDELVEPAERVRYVTALGSLARSGVLVERG